MAPTKHRVGMQVTRVVCSPQSGLGSSRPQRRGHRAPLSLELRSSLCHCRVLCPLVPGTPGGRRPFEKLMRLLLVKAGWEENEKSMEVDLREWTEEGDLLPGNGTSDESRGAWRPAGGEGATDAVPALCIIFRDPPTITCTQAPTELYLWPDLVATKLNSTRSALLQKGGWFACALLFPQRRPSCRLPSSGVFSRAVLPLYVSSQTNSLEKLRWLCSEHHSPDPTSQGEIWSPKPSEHARGRGVHHKLLTCSLSCLPPAVTPKRLPPTLENRMCLAGGRPGCSKLLITAS